ncbi:MAG: hypothetical protein R6U15_00935 [Candidatus Izemoplasmatales bacterium]
MEGITVIVVMFVLIIMAVAGNKIYNNVNDELQSDDDFSNSSKNLLNDKTKQYPQIFDGVFIFLLVGMWITSLAFAYFIDTTPILFVVSIILLIIILIIGAIISNAYIELTEEETFNSAPTDFPISYFIMSHLVETLIAIVLSITIVLFAKN